jgi:hypothetical protein
MNIGKYLDSNSIVKSKIYYKFNAWIETMPPRFEVFCYSDISGEILRTLGELPLEVLHHNEMTHYEDKARSKAVKYNLISSLREDFMPLFMGECDCLQVNVSINLVKNDLKTPTNILRLVSSGDTCEIKGDGYCNFPMNTKITSKLGMDINGMWALPIIENVQQHSPEFPLRECPYNVYTCYFPTNVGKFSILHYSDKYRHIMVQNKYVYEY